MQKLSSHRINLSLQGAIILRDVDEMVRLLKPDAVQKHLRVINMNVDALSGVELGLLHTIDLLASTLEVGIWSSTPLPALVPRSPLLTLTKTPVLHRILDIADELQTLPVETTRHIPEISAVLARMVLPHSDPNVVNEAGYTALHLAIVAQNERAFNLLYDVTDVKALLPTVNGATLLGLAAEFGTPAMVQRVLRDRANDLMRIDEAGETVLHYATRRSRRSGTGRDRLDVVNMLLDAIDPSLIWKHGLETVDYAPATALQMVVNTFLLFDDLVVQSIMSHHRLQADGTPQNGVLKAAERAIETQSWDSASAILLELPELVVRPWLTDLQKQRHWKSEVNAPIVDLLERRWEADLLRKTAEGIGVDTTVRARPRL